MSIQKPWYLEAIQPFKKYADFKGRASRREYWYSYLLQIILTLVFFFILFILAHIVSAFVNRETSLNLVVIVTALFSLAILLPNIAVTVRRLHDTGRSGWWYFITFIPWVGVLIFLVFLVSDSQPGTNQYGPNPKESVSGSIADLNGLISEVQVKGDINDPVFPGYDK